MPRSSAPTRSRLAYLGAQTEPWRRTMSARPGRAAAATRARAAARVLILLDMGGLLGSRLPGVTADGTGRSSRGRAILRGDDGAHRRGRDPRPAGRGDAGPAGA